MALAMADADTTMLSEKDPNNRFHSDGNLLVQFYKGVRKNTQRSAEEGRPIMEDRDYIRIRIPGNRNSEIDRPLRASDKVRFATYWKAYSENVEYQDPGTPLEAWPAIDRSTVEELKFFNVHSVEQLAALNDGEAQKFSGIMALKKKALAFIELAEGTGSIDRMVTELEHKEQEIQTLQEAMTAMAERISGLEEAAIAAPEPEASGKKPKK